MRNKLILLFVSLFLISLTSASIVNYTAYCVQETANESTTCGGLDKGTYTTNASNWNFLWRIYDKVWSSYGYVSDGIIENITANYSIPPNSTGAIWQVKDYSAITNITLPSNCFNTSKGNLTLILESFLDSGAAQAGTNFKSWNGSSYQTLAGSYSEISGSYARIYEESIIWLIPRNAENSQTFSSLVNEDSFQTYSINISYNSNIYTTITGFLNFNGTIYSSTISNYGDNAILNSSLTLPEITTPTNYSFYWIINMTNSTGTFSFNSSIQNQTVTDTIFKICDVTYNVSFINFSVKDLNTSNYMNASFKITINNYSYQDTSQQNFSFSFCYSKPESSYLIQSAKIDYVATNYAQNYYYLNNLTLTNATTHITLYLMPISLVDPVQLIVKDNSQVIQEDVYIQVQRYDMGTDTYYTIAMAKTDFNGQDIVYLEWYDTFYRYILTKNDEVVLMSSISKVYESPINFIIPEIFDLNYNKFNDVTYSLTYSNASNNFILTYSIPSGGVQGICLNVVKRTFKNDTTICNTCETSSSATIYCNIASYGNGTFYATVYGVGSYGVLQTITTIVGISNEIFEEIGNRDGSVYAFLFAGIIVSMFAISPALAIVGVLVGVIGAVAMGFQPLNYAELFGIVIIGVVIIIIIKR